MRHLCAGIGVAEYFNCGREKRLKIHKFRHVLRSVKPLRILHLDDNPLDAQLVAMTLEVEQEKLPTTVNYVQTKEAYLAALDKKDFDLILSDYRMGPYNGDQALASAKQTCPDIPFIMVTGELGEEMVIETLKRGATDYVLKDRIFRLMPAITRALAEREIRRKQQQAEEEAHKAHREANEVLESVQDPFYALDRDWRLSYVNSKAEALLGKPRAELIGKVLWEAFPQAIGTESHEMLLKAMEQRTPQHFETHSVITHSWLEVQVFPKADGGLSVFYRDITGRKAQEEALRFSEERFALAFRASPDPLVIGRVKDGTILDINESFLDLFGYKREEVIGQSSVSLGMFAHPKGREQAVALLRQEGKLRHFETHIRNRAGEERVVLLSSELLELQGESVFLTIMHDVTEQQQAQAALRESEGRVRRKLESILSPEGDLGALELADLIDGPALQKLLEEFHAVAHLPIGVIDVKGNVLVGIGWQNICTDFHRVHPETCKYCIESDTELSAGVPKGEFRLYKCKNNLWDIATPIIVGGHHVGNLFSGQFFFEEEAVDRDFFRAQARQYGFTEEEYLAALDSVPRLSRNTVEHGMAFLQTLADTISQLGYSNVKLARLLAERDRLTKELHDEQETFKTAQEIAHLGSWELDLSTNTLTWSDEVYRIFGMVPQEFEATYEAFLQHVHPDDKAAVNEAYSGSLQGNRDSYEVEHRVVRKGTGEIRIVHERCRHIRDSSGAIIRSVGMVLDITERKQTEQALRLSEERFRSVVENMSEGLMLVRREGTDLSELCIAANAWVRGPARHAPAKQRVAFNMARLGRSGTPPFLRGMAAGEGCPP